MVRNKKDSSLNMIVVIIGLTLIGKVVGLLRDTFIGYKLGADFESDVFFMALSLTTSVFLGIGSAIATNIIPIFVRYRKNQEDTKGISSIFNAVVLLSLVMGIAYYIAAPWIVKLFATGYTGEKLEMTIQMTRIMIPSILFISLTYLFVGAMQAHEKFILPAMISFPYNILFFIYLAIGIETNGIAGLALITMIGWLLQMIVLAPSVIKHKLVPLMGHIDFKHPALKHFFIGIIPIILVTLTHQFNIVIDNKAASFLGDGNVSAIYYGNMLFKAIVTTTVYGITAVMFPKFNEKFLDENHEGLYQSVINVLRSVLLLLIPMSIGLILTGPYVIALIFERGVFDASGTIATTIAFTGYTSFMIAFGFIDVLNKAYYTLGIRRIPLLIGGFIILVNIGLNNLLVGKYGFAGIANGTSIAFYCGAILSFFLFSRQFSSFPLHRFFNTLFKTLMATAVMGGSVYLLNQYLNPMLGVSTKGNLAIIGIDITLGMVIYGLTLILLKEQLIYNIYKQILDKFKQKHA